MTYRYLVAGLHVELDRAMPFLGDINSSCSDDVDVTIQNLEFSHASRPKKTISEASFSFNAKEGLVFKVSEGRHISIYRDKHISDKDVAIYLLGSAWGVLCHQRGLFPFHCSSVRFGSHAYAFAAPSGGGKSSLAAGLSSQGLAHFSDDVAVLSLNEDQNIIAHSMPKGIKLWQDTTEALGFDPLMTVTSDGRFEKFYVNTKYSSADTKLQLKCIYVLAFSSDKKDLCIEHLGPEEALMSVYRNVYLVDWLHLIGNVENVLSNARDIIEHIPVMRFTRPRDFEEFGVSSSFLTDHIKSQSENERSKEILQV